MAEDIEVIELSMYIYRIWWICCFYDNTSC